MRQYDMSCDPRADYSDNGIRYYEPVPHIVVYYSSSEKKLVSSIHHLPDTSTLHTAYPYQFVAKNNTTMTFKDGVISSVSSAIDTTDVPKSVISLLAGQAINNVKLGLDADGNVIPPMTPKSIYLFRLVACPDGSPGLIFTQHLVCS